jgi:pimeloyl-ACP methyl ester carboxylesterase
MRRAQRVDSTAVSDLRVRDERVDWEEIDRGHRVLLRRARLGLSTPAGHELSLRRATLPDGPLRPPVLLVHGLGQNRRSFRVRGRSLVGALAERGHDVYNLELRGHGDSRALGSRPARHVDEYVDDLTAVIGALPSAPYAIGHSLGAGVLVRAASRAPLAGLVHLAGVYTFARDNALLRAAAVLSQRIGDRVPPGLGIDLEPAGRAITRLGGLSAMINAAAPIQGWRPRSFERGVLRERLNHGFDRVGWGVWLDMADWATGGHLDPEREFSSVDVPLLVLSARGDRLATVRDAQACYEASGSADRTMVVFDRETHGVDLGHLDIVLGRHAPEIVWPVLTEWLRERAR